MNYRHSYHAGGFADVFKHIVLVALLQDLHRKEKGFCFLDTHAGIGCYDLTSKEASKTREATTGIEQIIKQTNQLPAEISAYLNAVKAVNPPNQKLQSPVHYYPGSPRVARYFLRPQDRMVLSELHPQDVTLLKQEFAGDKQAAVHEQNGYLALKAFLPPPERRGLVLIDPPYEQENETKVMADALQIAFKRWDTGIYAVWYPIKEKRFTESLQRRLKTITKDILFAELNIYPDDSSISLNGTGMAIINPPWQLDKQLKALLPWLWNTLAPQKTGSYRIIFANEI